MVLFRFETFTQYTIRKNKDHLLVYMESDPVYAIKDARPVFYSSFYSCGYTSSSMLIETMHPKAQIIDVHSPRSEMNRLYPLEAKTELSAKGEEQLMYWAQFYVLLSWHRNAKWVLRLHLPKEDLVISFNGYELKSGGKWRTCW